MSELVVARSNQDENTGGYQYTVVFLEETEAVPQMLVSVSIRKSIKYDIAARYLLSYLCTMFAGDTVWVLRHGCNVRRLFDIFPLL